MANPVEKVDSIPSEGPGLDRVLLRLVRPERLIYGAPISAGVGPDDLYCTVLREIDETILPRELLIESKVFGTIRLSVSNRRLAAIRFDHDDDSTPLVSAENSHDLAQQLANVLKQAFETSENARILHPRRLPPGTSFNMSCSAHSLAEAAGIVDFAHPSCGSAAKFVDVLDDLAVAKIKVGTDDDLSDGVGEADDLDVLKEFYLNFQTVAQSRKQAHRVNSNEPRCLIVPLTVERTLILAVRDSNCHMAIVPSQSADRVMRAWHDDGGFRT